MTDIVHMTDHLLWKTWSFTYLAPDCIYKGRKGKFSHKSRLGKNPKSRGSLDRLSSKLSARFWKLSASTYPPARRAGSPWGPRQEFFWFLNLSRCIYRPLFNDFFILFLFYSIFIFILAAILFKIYTTPWTGGMGIAQTRRIEIPNSVGTF